MKGKSEPRATLVKPRRASGGESWNCLAWGTKGRLPLQRANHSRASAGSQADFMRLRSRVLPCQFPHFSQRAPSLDPCALCTHSCLALSISGLATYPIPRVLFSAREGKRCWLLSRDAYVDMKDPRYFLLTPASSGGERGTGKEKGTLGPYREQTLGDSHPLFPLTKCPGDPWLRAAQALA